MKRILMIKTSALGDIVHAYPVIDYLHTLFPGVHIDWVVEKPCASLVQAHPKINQVFLVETKAWRRHLFQVSTYQEICKVRKELRAHVYDVAFDLQGNVKSGLILSQVKALHKVGYARKSVPEWPNLLFTNKRFDCLEGNNIREDYLCVVKSFFKDSAPYRFGPLKLSLSDIEQASVQSVLQHPMLEQGLKVLVCPGSNWSNKQLTQEALLTFLCEIHRALKCKFLFLWGTPEEREVAFQLHQELIQNSCVVDRMSLPMVQNLMAAFDLVIAMDSLPLHLAGTTSTPTYSIFGPSLAQKYKPIGEQHVAFQGVCPYGRTFEKRCPVLRSCSTGACIRELPGRGELLSHFLQWWTSLGYPSH